MTDQPTYTEYRADPSGLRKRPGERLRSGNFEYPTYPFVAPPELRDEAAPAGTRSSSSAAGLRD